MQKKPAAQPVADRKQQEPPPPIAKPKPLATWFLCLAAALTVAALAIHIRRLSGLAFTTYDDMSMGLVADAVRAGGWGAYYASASSFATSQGRVYFYFSVFFFMLPFLIRSLLVRAAAAALLQLLTTCAIGALLGFYVGWMDAVLYVCLVSCSLPYWPTRLESAGYHGPYPVNSLPFVYHMPALLFFTGMAAYVYLARAAPASRKLRRLCQALSLLLVFVSLFFYEAVILPFLIVCLVVVASETRRVHGTLSIRQAARAAAPWLSLFAVWAVIYFGYRSLHPVTYTGTQLRALSWSGLATAARSLSYFVAFALPGVNFTANLNTIAFHGGGSVQDLGFLRFAIRNFGAGSGLLALLMLGVTGLWAANFRSAGSRAALGPRGMVFVGILALVCVVMPPALLVLTPKYGTVEAARFWAPYLTGYYSFLAWMVVLTLAFPVLALALGRWRNAWMAAMAFLGIGCASVTAMNAVANNAISRTQEQFSAKWKLVDVLVRTRFFTSLPPDTVFIAPTLWDGLPDTVWNLSGQYWTDYFSARATHPLRVVSEARQVAKLLQHAPVYYLEHQWLPGRQDSVLLISPIAAVSPADGRITSESALFVARTAFRDSAMEFLSSVAGPNQLTPGFWRLDLSPFRYQNGAFLSELRTPGLIVGTGRLVDEAAGQALSGTVKILFKRGFSETEHGDGHHWRWSDGQDGEGEFDLVNLLPQPVLVRFRTILRFEQSQKTVAFDFKLPNASETVAVADGELFERVWTLQPGSNVILVKCHGRRIRATADPRYIVFGFWDWSVLLEPAKP